MKESNSALLCDILETKVLANKSLLPPPHIRNLFNSQCWTSHHDNYYYFFPFTKECQISLLHWQQIKGNFKTFQFS